MTVKVKRVYLSAMLLCAFAIGCGSNTGPTEIKPDPALAGKPFPKAGGRQTP